MNISVFGTGMVGRVIAERFLSDGNAVIIGTRNEEDTLGNPTYKEWQQTHPQMKLGTLRNSCSR